LASSPLYPPWRPTPFTGVAVVVPTVGRPTLRDSLASVARQTLLPDLVVVVGDGCSPPTSALPLALRDRCLWVALPQRQGHVAARQEGLRRIGSCSHVAFLDDDDVWLSPHLEGVLAAARKGSALAYADAEVVYLDSAQDPPQVLGRQTFALPWDPLLLTRYNLVVPSAALWDRAALDRVGGLSAEAGHHWDWDLALKAARQGLPVERVPQATVLYRVDVRHPGESARREEMEQSVQELSQRHRLGSLATHTFATMLQEPDVKARLMPTRLLWDGRWP
jgi:GT2 family glycosyltransferase